MIQGVVEMVTVEAGELARLRALAAAARQAAYAARWAPVDERWKRVFEERLSRVIELASRKDTDAQG